MRQDKPVVTMSPPIVLQALWWVDRSGSGCSKFQGTSTQATCYAPPSYLCFSVCNQFPTLRIPIYTITLNWNSTDVGGAQPSPPHICSPLFSQTGLDLNKGHEIRLSIKGLSPNHNQSIPNSDPTFVLSLINFMWVVVHRHIINYALGIGI